MSLQSTPTQVLARRLRAREAELERASGFVAARLQAEVDELRAELADREYVSAHEDPDDTDEHG